MTRRIVNVGSLPVRSAAADALDELVGPPRQGAKRRPSIARLIAVAIESVNRRLELNNWSEIKPTTIVQVWVWCHTQTYGVEPGLTADEWHIATVRCAQFARINFGGDFEKVLEFVRWSWQREKRFEAWRRENSQGGSVMGWAKQFSPKLLTDYRIECNRGTA